MEYFKWVIKTPTGNARVSVLLYTTPGRFQNEVWQRVVKNKDGLDDRFLITSVNRPRYISTQKRMEAKAELQNSAVKQLDSVYKMIFHEHENARLYTLTKEAC